MRPLINQNNLLLSEEYIFDAEDRNTIKQFSMSRGVRSEAYPVFREIIELIWSDFISMLNADINNIYSSQLVFTANKSTNLLDFKSDVKQLDSEILKRLIVKEPRRNIWIIRDAFALLVSKNLVAAMEKFQDHDRYKFATKFVTQLDYYKNVNENKRLIAMIHGGIYTAIFFNFDIIRAAPVLVFKKTNQLITQEHYRNVVMHSLRLLAQAASMHHDMRTSAREFAKQSIDYTETSISPSEEIEYEFPINFFEYDSEAEQIIFNFKALQEWRKHVESNGLPQTERLGCPARNAKYSTSEGGPESVFSTFLESQFNFTLKYLNPALQEYSRSY